MAQARTSQARIELGPFDPSDFPIAFCWMEASWFYLASDWMPKNIDSYIDFEMRRNAEHFGVYCDGHLVGLLTKVARDPDVMEGHCIFRSSTGHHTMIAALEAAKRAAWSLGFKKIVCRVFEDNRLMRSLLMRVGGEYEGLLIQEVRREGKLVNMVRYALLKNAA